jgi:hypothetical protein
MSKFSFFHWLVVVFLVIVLLLGRKIPEILRHLGDGPRGGPPTHPLPVTSPIETSRASRTPEKSGKPSKKTRLADMHGESFTR